MSQSIVVPPSDVKSSAHNDQLDSSEGFHALRGSSIDSFYGNADIIESTSDVLNVVSTAVGKNSGKEHTSRTKKTVLDAKDSIPLWQ
mmetsp:Transcript_22595/g.51774  ORF Transcript_22595/g.51774 Transcript_22595/m.51774 type:complete len:87 (-) Transcript_22595:561-821(-)